MRPAVDPRIPPDEFDDVVDWFERISYQLVLLEEYPANVVRTAVREFDLRVRDHLRMFEPPLIPLAATSIPLSESRAILRSDHAWFLTSLEQLDWFYRIVEAEDHGGHRQALGQYGRVLAESLRRHRNDERAYLAATTDRPRAAPP